MYISEYRKGCIANGPGVRTVVFVSGCTHNCPGCFNREAMNFKNGEPFTADTKETILKDLQSSYVSGLTVLGGEPFQQTKDRDLIELLQSVKKAVPDKEIWIFSGYTYDEIIQDPKKKEILDLCDVLVDGKFVEELKDIRLKFRGSHNQRIIDIKNSSPDNISILQKHMQSNI